MVKKIKSYKDIQSGDVILLYGASDNGKVVQKRYLEIESNPSHYSTRIIWVRCYIVREDGSRIRDKWTGCDKYCSLSYYKDNSKFICNDGTHNWYYIDPKIPCETIIKRLIEEKRKINKKIIDCQNYMYKISEK